MPKKSTKHVQPFTVEAKFSLEVSDVNALLGGAGMPSHDELEKLFHLYESSFDSPNLDKLVPVDDNQNMDDVETEKPDPSTDNGDVVDARVDVDEPNPQSQAPATDTANSGVTIDGLELCRGGIKMGCITGAPSDVAKVIQDLVEIMASS